ncbi:hypothetical protein KPH14_005521 [Odynerus spinipes]|uniref:Uncharacterized protein n=1 Tax=Odynerus spinipes TaxID=1348599 RepID=A0AAD9RC18_9HYME|nr:hypothetical protein KPH14_005521 [Odynerus spinipes]
MDIFLHNLTDLTYKMLGLTVIYIPTLSKGLTVQKAIADKELVKRLESVVTHWNTQIKVTLVDEEEVDLNELLSIDDEYNFWIYRYDNLCGLNYQLQKSAVQYIVNILLETQSTYIRQFLATRDEIQQETLEARSNIEYLTLLKEPCEELQRSATPDEVAQLLPKIIHLCRTIWLNSPFYNTTERMTNIFTALSNQIIIILKDFIDLRRVFEGMTRESIDMFVDCIQACEDYKTHYLEISAAHNNLTEHSWELDTEYIFRHVNVFIKRCQDMIIICEAMIDFARMDERTAILKPKFGGTKGEEHSRACQKIERLFLESLQKIESNSHKIFNVLHVAWQNIMFTFHTEVRELEIIIENLVGSVFVDINNVQEGVENLRGFYNYMNREKLQELFDNKTVEIWKMFDDDLQNAKQELLDEKEEYSSMMPYYSGRALALRQKADTLRSTRKMLEEAEWMPLCGMKFETFRQHDLVIKSMEDAISDLHRQWIEAAGENPRTHLDRSLMKRSPSSPILLECNMDPFVLDLCRECDCWINLRHDIPIQMQVIHVRWNVILFVYESVLAVVYGYNKIIEALSDTERRLFRELIQRLDGRINPGLNRLTWNTDNVDTFIEDCYNQTANLREFIDIYKKSNFEILKICENICDSPMIKIKPNHAYGLLELEEELLNVRDAVIVDMVAKYETVAQYVTVVLEGFRPVIQEIKEEWRQYLGYLDAMIEEAMRFCLKGSMEIMYVALHGDGATGPSPLLLVHVDLLNNKINFTPSLSDIARTLANVLNHLLTPIKNFQRLVERFKVSAKDTSMHPFWKVFEKDEDLINYQQSLNNETTYCFSQVQTYLKTWEPFRDVWEVNKDLFIQRYEKLKPTVTSFDSDISRYAEVANNVEMQETVMNVHFLDVNCDGLKSIIVQECATWQEKLTALMQRVTEAKIDHVYQYIAENSKQITKEPTDLISMQFAMQLFERLHAEIPKEEEEFPKILELYETLEKYEVTTTFEFKRKLKDIDRSWAAYLELLAACEAILLEKKEEFKNALLKDSVMFNEDIMTLKRKYYDTGPFTSEWQTQNALAWISIFQKEIHALKEREKMLKAQLTVFGLSQPDSLDLIQLEQDVAIIEIVWRLTAEWDEAWNRYKTEQFWKIEMEEMETTANILFRKLTRLCKELKEKNWEIVEHTRFVEDFYFLLNSSSATAGDLFTGLC